MPSDAPVVSLVVPCYKLAHVLGDCLDSILRQTYEQFEILVMDDCSPDHTGEVVASYRDPRIRYIRNDPNLGHLRNYNKGITLARGRHVWLISADDRLRESDILARYARILDASPQISFACCPGVEIDAKGRDIGLQGSIGSRDRLFSSEEFVRLLVERNRICTPSVLARREIWMSAGLFPMDLPYAGDWYLWSRFAMIGPVAYVAKPSVDYRIHEAAQTHQYLERSDDVMVRDEIEVRWRLLGLLRQAGRHRLAEYCGEAIVLDYADRLRPGHRSRPWGLTNEQVERSVGQHAATRNEAAIVLSSAYGLAADNLQQRGEHAAAAAFYLAAWKHVPRSKHGVKYLLARLGSHGDRLRYLISQIAHRTRRPLTSAPEGVEQSFGERE